MSWEQTMRLAQTLAETGLDSDQKVMVALLTRGVITAPNDLIRERAARFLEVYKHGHVIRWKTFPATFSTVPVDDELRNAVEEALSREGDHDE